MQLDAGVGQQPLVHRRCLVRGELVADDVDGQAGVGLLVDLIEEVAEVGRPVLRGQMADDLAGGGVQRGEQVDGAVPDVIMATPLGHARDHRLHRHGPLQHLDLRLLIDRKDRRVPGGAKYRPITSRILSISSGSGKILKSSVRQG